MDFSTFQFSDLKKCLLMGLYLLFAAGQLFAEACPEFSSGSDTPPALTLTCPDNVYTNPPPGECGLYLDFDDLQWSSSIELVDTLFTPNSFFWFGYGTTPVTLSVTDINGDTASCTFTVNVTQFQTQPECTPVQFVYITDSCDLAITPDMILTGGPYGCNEGYEAIILNSQGQPIGNEVDISFVGSPYTVQVSDVFSNLVCWGQILVSGDSLPQTITCPPDITIACHIPPESTFTGVPGVESCFPFEEIELEYEDEQLNSFCDGDDIAFEITRTWTATSPFTNISTCEQVIAARRLQLTEILFPPDYDGTDLPPLTCSDTLSPEIQADTSITGIPRVNGFNPISVACNLAITMTDSILNVCGAHFEIMRTWEAIDYCEDEKRVHVQHIVILDDAAPVFDVPDTLLVSINPECNSLTTFPPIELIEECSGFQVQIQTPWGILNTNGGVIDVAQEPGLYEADYIVTDDCQNQSSAKMYVLVTDGIISSCPPNQWVSCHTFNEQLLPALDTGDLSVLVPYGDLSFFANCDFQVDETATVDVDSCGEGVITRTFSVDLNGQTESCQQQISVETVSGFVVEFPGDRDIQCDSMPGDFGEPKISGLSCENIEISYTDEVFVNVPDYCYKIHRTWMVANTCVTGAVPDDEIVEVSEANLGLPFPDCDLDGDGDCDSLTFRDSWTAAQMPGADVANQPFSPDTDPDSDPWDGYVTYQQVINVNDTVPPIMVDCTIPDVCITGATCDTDVMLPFPEAVDCQETLNYSAVSELGIGFGPFEDVPLGTYTVTYFAVDNCNNQSLCQTTVTVVDCSPPTPVCQSQLILDLAPNTPPSIGLFASELNNGSVDNCLGGLQFSFSEDTDDVSRVFFCDDIGQQTLELYVTDLSGNQSICSLFILVQDPSFLCDPPPPSDGISGNIETEEDLGIANVSVSSTQGFNTQTDLSGLYQLETDNSSNSTSVIPIHDVDPLNGVTTFDAVLIIKHVLGNEPLTSPYKLIAGDVNSSGSVSTFDAVEIRKLILGITSQFPNNTSWRFVPEAHIFFDPQDPFAMPFPEMAVVDLPHDGSPVNFVAIKTGDLNASASPNFAGSIDERTTSEQLTFSFPDTYARDGSQISIPFHMPEEVLLGAQFALQFNTENLKLLRIEPGIFDEKSFGKNELANGILKTSWVPDSPFRANVDDVAFTLHFLVKNGGATSDFISLREMEMQAEAYTEGLEIMGVEIRATNLFDENLQAPGEMIVFPNRPEPFYEQTAIPFKLPTAAEVTFQVFDASGRQVISLSQNFAEGYQEIVVQGDELPGAGVYFFRISSEMGTAEGKLVRR